MRILGVGLSKPGTNSLHRALQMLGYTSLHDDETRMNVDLRSPASEGVKAANCIAETV